MTPAQPPDKKEQNHAEIQTCLRLACLLTSTCRTIDSFVHFISWSASWETWTGPSVLSELHKLISNTNKLGAGGCAQRSLPRCGGPKRLRPSLPCLEGRAGGV